MSCLPMYKKCANCGRSFTYNPSTGDMGIICPYCGKPAAHRLNSEGINQLKKAISDILKL